MSAADLQLVPGDERRAFHDLKLRRGSPGCTCPRSPSSLPACRRTRCVVRASSATCVAMRNAERMSCDTTTLVTLELALQLHDEPRDRAGGERIESRRRLVVEHDLRDCPPCRARCRRASHAARELGRQLLHHPVGIEIDELAASRARAPRSRRRRASCARAADRRRSRRRTSSRTARRPETPCPSSGEPASASSNVTS